MKKGLNFFSELLRRKVVRLLGAYVVILWLLIQGFSDLFPILGFPDWALRAFVIVGIAAIPVLAWLSWKYDIMPPQLVKDSKDVEATNPALSWAMHRHDNLDAGYALLRWTESDGATTEKRFFKPLSIGRTLDNDVVFSDERVSRHHAVIWAEEGGWRVKDTESANGTFMNHAPVTESTTLPQSCELRFHPNGPTLRVVVDKPAETKIT
ncbi:MAG: FHA domain-containing protein [Gammaproteobacteria bacterium]